MARAAKAKNGLTEKQERFCHEFVNNGGNASEAYRICYDTSSMQYSTIWSEASRLLKNPHVTARVDELRANYAKRYERGRDIATAALIDIMEANADDLYYTDSKTGKVKLRTPSQLPKRARNAMRRMTNSNGLVSYELNNKVDAIKTFAAMNGLNSPQEHIHKGNVNIFGQIMIGFDDKDNPTEI